MTLKYDEEKLPYFEDALSLSDTIDLLQSPLKKALCEKQPFGVTKSRKYLINLNHIPLGNICCDGTSNWINNSYTITKDGLRRQYHYRRLSGENRFNRVISTLVGGKAPRVALVEYSFRFEEEVIVGKPHGNTKRHNNNFTPTLPSIRNALQDNCQLMKPKQAVAAIHKQQPITEARSATEVVRNIRQAKYCRQKNSEKLPLHLKGNVEKDELFNLVYDMKTENSIIRKIIHTSDSCCVIVASEEQLRMLEKSVCVDGSVLQIDPTFNLGNYEVTAMSFPDTLLEKVADGKNPLYLGPVMLHTRKDIRSYAEFYREICSLVPKLPTTPISLGTDGEQALISAAESVMNIKVHLRCFRHVKLNLQSLTPGIDKYWKTILGYYSRGQYVEGIVDSRSAFEIQHKIDNFIAATDMANDSVRKVSH